MKKVVASLIIMVVIMTLAVGLTSCGGESVTKLKEENSTMAQIIKEDENKIKSMEETLKALSGEEPKTAISVMGDNSAQTTFNSIKNKILFPSNFTYPNSTQSPNTAAINISENVSVKPSNNWVIKMDGSTTHFVHPSNIVGTIKVGVIQEALQPETMQDLVFKPFLQNMPCTGVTYKTIFIDGTGWGEYADIGTTVDKKPATIKAGAIGIGNTSVIYMFYYTGASDATKNEVIDSLIKTMAINNEQISFN